jgi:hypothetical protein
MKDDHSPTQSQSGHPNGLTCIHQPIHCAATRDTTSDEIERLQVEAFLQTLAEIAMSIARRQLNRNTKRD